MSSEKPSRRDQSDWAAIVVALALPSAITWLYFFRAEETTARIQLAVFNVVKIIQFAFPIVWVLAVQKRRVHLCSLLEIGTGSRSHAQNDGDFEPSERACPIFQQAGRPRGSAGIGIGVAFGVVVAAAMLAIYWSGLRSSAWLEGASAPIREKISGFGIDAVPKYLGLGLFYSLCHSLLEEYYWRWFVFGQLVRRTTLIPAVAISSVGFMAHHVLVLGKFFGFDSPATWALSACVAIGGAMWAWLYHRSGSLLGPWLSHALVDAAIFAIGYDLVRDLLNG